MIKKCIYIVLIFFVTAFGFDELYAQPPREIDGSTADRIHRRVGVHRGNQVRTVFGNWGVVAQPSDQGPMGAWRHDYDGYVGDVSIIVGAEVLVPKDGGIVDTVQHIVVTPVNRPGPGLPGPPGGGAPWTFEPIPGFFNPLLNEPGKGLAMSHQPETWPHFWPDQPTWVDSLGFAEWNGYFGRGIIQADQESYFWFSDHPDRELFINHGFTPDSLNPNRRGLGLNVKVRGLQWANLLAEDNIFWLYDITNEGTTDYRRTVFGILIGTWVGGGQGVTGDWEDDVSFFDIEEDITYTWNFQFREPRANPRWLGPVGIVGYAFLESPGNPFDGIDNDGTSVQPGSPLFTEDDFGIGPVEQRNFPRTLNRTQVGPNTNFPNNRIVLIKEERRWSDLYQTNQLWYVREVVNLDTLLKSNADTVTVFSLGRPYQIYHGKNLVEVANNGFDDNLNGLIDENYQLHYEQIRLSPQGEILFRRLRPVAYANYFTGAGVDDPLIDERRDDGIDNDGDWNPLLDDVGEDGVPDSGAPGEGDGIPTPGEPNFDQTDVNESDQIGLTSFEYFVPADALDLRNNPNIWLRMRPGYFAVPRSFRYNPVTGENEPLRGEDGDLIYTSGYFPLAAGLTERMSVALLYGQDFDQLFFTKRTVQDIYDANYQFPQPPDKPTLTVVPGDGNVTLIWDDTAEMSFDRVIARFYNDEDAGFDFEGYKIYRARDPDFREIRTITDGKGIPRFLTPLAQFDRNNGIEGFFPSSPDLNQRVAGSQFWLGDDSGIRHRYVDTDVKNGVTYYYAVVAYDRGAPEYDVFPSENTRFLSTTITGEVLTDINTAVAVPNAPVAGYVPPEGAGQLEHAQGPASGAVFSSIINPRDIINNQRYRVVFSDTSLSKITESYSVVNVTDPAAPDTIIRRERSFTGETMFFDGYQLSFNNIWEVQFVDTLSSWEGTISGQPDFQGYRFRMDRTPIASAIRYPADYRIEFFDEVVGRSVRRTAIPGSTERDVTFTLRNETDGTNPPFVFSANPVTDPVGRSFTIIVFDTVQNIETPTWRIVITGLPGVEMPGAGNALTLRTVKPFSSRDVFEFTSVAESFDSDTAGTNLDNIRVVPNPYVAAANWEQPLPPGVISGRGERKIDFINVPPGSKIEIYSSRGAHIITLNHDGNLYDGSVSWNLRTRENLDVAFGVYFYVVTAPGIGQKFGRLAIIK
jgi:hypothetical protein